MKPVIGIIVLLSCGTTHHLQCDHASLLAIQAAGGQVQLLPILVQEGEQQALSALTEALRGVDGLLLTKETTLPFAAAATEQSSAAWWETRACQVAHSFGLPVLGLGQGAYQLATAFGGSLHPGTTTRSKGAGTDTTSPSKALVMLDHTCFSLCMPESKAHQMLAEEEVFAVESVPQGRVKRLASPFTAWAWSCRDASIVGFGTALAETGWYAVGTCLPAQQEGMRETLFSRLLFDSFVEAARARGTRQQVDDALMESSFGARSGSLDRTRASSTVVVSARLPFFQEEWRKGG